MKKVPRDHSGIGLLHTISRRLPSFTTHYLARESPVGGIAPFVSTRPTANLDRPTVGQVPSPSMT